MGKDLDLAVKEGFLEEVTLFYINKMHKTWGVSTHCCCGGC